VANRFRVTVVTSDDADQRLPPTELAAELLRCIEQQALLNAEDDHPYGVSIVGTRAEGDDLFVVFRQARSPHLYGTRENAVSFSAGFAPHQTPTELAEIFLQDLSEPHGPGRPAPCGWGAGLVPDPAVIEWLGESSPDRGLVGAAEREVR